MSNIDKYGLDWSELFEYAENSPSGLVWKVDRTRGNKAKPYVFIRKGEMVGSVNKLGYWKVSLYLNSKTQTFAIHRIVYILLKGIIESSNHIDHIDGNPSNNKITNLRQVPQEKNCRNMKKYSSNTTGITGIYFTVRYNAEYDLTTEYYSASWMELNGKQKSKSYSINKYGKENALTMAIDYRNKVIKRLNEEGGDYTDRHGL